MMRFYAPTFALAMSKIADTVCMLKSANYFDTAPDPISDRRLVMDCLEQFQSVLGDLPLSRSLYSQYTRLWKSIELADGALLAILLGEFHQNVIAELTGDYFLMIPNDKREYFEQREPPFGMAVSDHFPEATKDIAAAGRCFALDEWTACIFHLMRVLEHGLRFLAGKVGLPAEVAEHSQWHNIIDQIEAAITKKRKGKVTPQIKKDIQFHSEAAMEFRGVKDAWRNYVMHAHATYDERDAKRIWSHVRSLMEHLAS